MSKLTSKFTTHDELDADQVLPPKEKASEQAGGDLPHGHVTIHIHHGPKRDEPDEEDEDDKK